MSFVKSKPFIATLIFIAVIVIVFSVRNTTSGVQTNNLNSSKISLTDLSEHNTNEDCWIAYGGKVYDLTSWLPQHPGTSEAISPYCGTAKEFQTAFEKKHGTSKVKLLIQVGTFMGDLQIVGSLNS